MKIYCIIVTYNGMKWISQCLESTTECDTPLSVIVIDNGSTDGTCEYIAENFPAVDLIKSGVNEGFGKANNIGIEKALENDAEYIFLLNQDAFFKDGSLKALVEILENNASVGIISPVHLSGDMENLDYKFRRYIAESTYVVDSPNVQPLYYANFINAAAWLVKASVFKKIGLFHPLFEHYSEDMEFVYRLHKNGFNMAFSPLSTVIHDRQQFDSIPVGKQEKRYFTNSIYMNYLTKNRSLTSSIAFIILSIFKSLATLNFKSAYYKFRTIPEVYSNIRKYGNLYR